MGAMYYPDEVVEEVRMKNDIVDVISGYVKITREAVILAYALFIMKSHLHFQFRKASRCFIVSAVEPVEMFLRLSWNMKTILFRRPLNF